MKLGIHEPQGDWNSACILKEKDSCVFVFVGWPFQLIASPLPTLKNAFSM